MAQLPFGPPFPPPADLQQVLIACSSTWPQATRLEGGLAFHEGSTMGFGSTIKDHFCLFQGTGAVGPVSELAWGSSDLPVWMMPVDSGIAFWLPEDGPSQDAGMVWWLWV